MSHLANWPLQHCVNSNILKLELVRFLILESAKIWGQDFLKTETNKQMPHRPQYGKFQRTRCNQLILGVKAKMKTREKAAPTSLLSDVERDLFLAL